MNVFQGVLNQLVAMEVKLDDEIHALCLISSLLDSEETPIVFLINYAPNSVLTLKIVNESMLNKEK